MLFTCPFEVRWSDVAGNRHVRNTAFAASPRKFIDPISEYVASLPPPARPGAAASLPA